MDPSNPREGSSGERSEYGPNEAASPIQPTSEPIPAAIFRQPMHQAPLYTNTATTNASLPILERQLSLESEDLPDTRKRRKLSEYAHLDALHAERTRQGFYQLQREAASDLKRIDGGSEHLGDSSEFSVDPARQDEDEIDITGSGDDLEDGHFVLQAQWQAQRDSVRKKKKRKSITFGERREPHEDRETFSPTKRSEPRTLSPLNGHTKVDMNFGAHHARTHPKRGNNLEGDDYESDNEDISMMVDEAGQEVSTRDFYKASNVILSKMEEDEDADIADDHSTPPVAPTAPFAISKATEPAPATPRVKLVLRSKSEQSIPKPPPIARRSSRLHQVEVVEYEYDVMDQTNTEESEHAQFKTPQRALEYKSRKAPNTAPSKKPKPSPSPSKRATSATPKPIRNKLDHGITSESDLEQFYLSLQRKDYQKKVPQPKGMVPVLFSYQLRAVSWMAERESKTFFRDGVRGGLLADEMGLGKTIEMMALIISNPRSKYIRPASAPISQTSSQSSRSMDSDAAIAPSDLSINSVAEPSEEEVVEPLPWKPFLTCEPWIEPPADCHDSSCTLIVCPDILLSQWREEMARHAPSLVVATYRGVPNLTPLEIAFDQNGDSIFASYDVVMCSYETLAREFPYSTKPNVKTRHQNDQNSTPLAKLRWWRIVMDEAQMFSQGASNAGKLLRNLQSINRWAVSGTPVRKDFADLRGLLLFLDAEYAYFKPTDEALNFIRSISWRHQMEQVSDEIIIPPSEENILNVSFTPLEAFGLSKLSKKMKHSQDQPLPVADSALPPATADGNEIIPPPNPEALPTSWSNSEILSHSHGKYASAPYHVMHDRYLETKAVLASSDRALLCRSLSTSISNELYSSQLAVCHAYNDLGDANLAQAQKLALMLESADSEHAKVSLRNVISQLAHKAVDSYQYAIDLVTYRVNTPIHNKLVFLRTPHFSLSPPSAPFSTVWYHTLKGMVAALGLLGRKEEAALLEGRAESVRGTALQSQLNSVASAKFKFSNVKQETSRLVRNRLSFTRGEWWYHALQWIGQNVPEFCHRLRHGVAQSFDTKFSGLRNHTLQLNVSTVEDVIDKLDLDLGKMHSQRTESITLSKTPVPTSGDKLDTFYETLDAADESIYQYQQLLLKEKQIQNNLTGQGFSVPILNLAERLLLYIEYVIVDRHNIIMHEYRFHPERVSSENEATLFKLARWLLMAEASFRELELMKLEVEQAQAYNKVKRDFASSLSDLEESALPKPLSNGKSSATDYKSSSDIGTMEVDDLTTVDPKKALETTTLPQTLIVTSSTTTPDLDALMGPFNDHLSGLREKLDKALNKCLACKHQLEFVLETGREKAPRNDAFGSKIAVVANKLIELLQDSEEQVRDPTLLRNKALVFSKWSEPLIQIATLLKEQGIQFHFGKDAGGAGDKSAAALVKRLAAFRDDPEIRVLFLNSKSQSTGLTLTQANHVFILEDLESAHELQAIGRAHRIGQTRITHIWKFTTQPGQIPDFSGDVSDLIC